jgi:hypothetical protein
MPERSHLSDLHGAGRRQVMQGREAGATAGAAPSGGAAGYLAVERCCVVATSAAAPPGLSPRPVCHPLAVGQIRATVKVIGGPVYAAHEIDRLHYGPKPNG